MPKIETFQIYVKKESDAQADIGRVFYVFGERIEAGTAQQRQNPISFISSPETPLLSRRADSKQLIDPTTKAVMETIELNDDENNLNPIGKKFSSIEWSQDKKAVLLQSFAQKPTDFSVYISRAEAMKYINANNVYVQKGRKAFHVSTPLFRVQATEIDLNGKAAYQITIIDKVYFRGESGLIDASLGEVATSDRTNTEANDFIFTPDRIQDTIIPAIPVTVTQDAKINIALMICTFIFQVVQWALTRYLPTSEATS